MTATHRVKSASCQALASTFPQPSFYRTKSAPERQSDFRYGGGKGFEPSVPCLPCVRWNVSIRPLARPERFYLSSQMSSLRLPLEMLLAMIVSPLT
jgi:hypothetical protein